MAEEARSDWLWPAILVGLLVFMITASLAFYAIAVRFPDAQVVHDAYAAGLAWNEERRIHERAAARGLAIEIAPEVETGSARVRVALRARSSGAAVGAQRVRVARIRPTRGGLDQEFELQPRGDFFEGEIPLPLPGRWQLVARVWRDGEEMRETARVWRP